MIGLHDQSEHGYNYVRSIAEQYQFCEAHEQRYVQSGNFVCFEPLRTQRRRPCLCS